MTWTATFTADDDFDGTGSMTVTGAYADLVGNVGATGAADEVDIDRANPTVTDVTASDLVISDADAGGTFSVAVTFSEAMDQTVAPVLTFDPAVASTLSSTSGRGTPGGRSTPRPTA